MVLALVDEIADVVKDRGIFQPVAFGRAEAVEPPGLVEQSQGEAGHMQAVDFGSLAAAGQCQHVAAPQVGNLGFGLDPLAVAHDEIVDHTFANRLVAEDEFVPAGQLHQAAKDDGRREQRIDALGVQSGNGEAFFDRRMPEILLDFFDVFQRNGREIELRQRPVRSSQVDDFGKVGRHAGRGDHAVEAFGFE